MCLWRLLNSCWGKNRRKTICLEISLDRDVAKTGEIRRADLNEVIYPGNAPKRAGEEGKIPGGDRDTGTGPGAWRAGSCKLCGGIPAVLLRGRQRASSHAGGGPGERLLAGSASGWCCKKTRLPFGGGAGEFALLQTIGMTRGRILKMLILEHFLYALAGLGFGIPVSLFILTGLYNDGGSATDDVSRGCALGPGGRPGADDRQRAWYSCLSFSCCGR